MKITLLILLTFITVGILSYVMIETAAQNISVTAMDGHTYEFKSGGKDNGASISWGENKTIYKTKQILYRLNGNEITIYAYDDEFVIPNFSRCHIDRKRYVLW